MANSCAIEIVFKSWGLFRIYKLISAANPALLKWNWAGMAALIKGQLISKCLFEKIVWTKIPPKDLVDSALKYCRAESIQGLLN